MQTHRIPPFLNVLPDQMVRDSALLLTTQYTRLLAERKGEFSNNIVSFQAIALVLL
jgi:hypothetical protein